MEQQIVPSPTPRAGKKPRGRMTAYAFFVQACRQEYELKNPTGCVNYSEFFKDCGDRWKSMTDEEKKCFNEMAENDKIRYLNEMKNYPPPDDDKKRKIKQVDSTAPKRNFSAFFWYCQDNRDKVKAENPEDTVGRIATRLGEMWMDADSATKNKYETMADRDKARFQKEWAAYQNKKKSDVNDSQVGDS